MPGGLTGNPRAKEPDWFLACSFLADSLPPDCDYFKDSRKIATVLLLDCSLEATYSRGDNSRLM